MNYFGKFDAKHYADSGLDAHSGAHLHLDSISGHAPSGTIVVPDAELLFTGDFKRSGVDLIVSKDDRELVLQDYFKGEKRAVLASPDGAQLSGDLVNALSGHVEYAQAAGASDAAKIIGHVTKVTGSASALRNGVVITLNEGDNVAKGDVVQTGSDSQLGITFIDGTVFGLSSKARMVLNEMVYDPNGSNNSSLLSLVAGTISFVAGETAKHGDMKVNTPVATMGIRGTNPLAEMAELVEVDFNVPAPGGPVKFQVLTERDGHTGSYILYSLTDPTVEIGRVNQSGLVTAVTGLGQITTAPAPPLSPAAVAIIGAVVEQFFQNAQQPPNPNPQTHSPPPGSTPPAPPPASKPGDTSPINNLPVGTPTTVPIPINLLAPTTDNPNGVTTVTIPVTITVLKAVNVTPAVDQTSFQIADHVTIADSQPADTLVPFVAGSATIVSAVGPADTPTNVNLASLVSVDPQTGAVTYDPASFAFLKSGEKVTVTVGFDTRAGTDTFHETLVLTIDAQGAIHWTNANGGDFAVATNWSNGVVPGAGDNAAIDAVGSYIVTSTVNETVNSLTVAPGVTLDVTGGTFTVENGTGAGGNAGTIIADGAGVQINADSTNTGTLEATLNGVLEITGASIANAGGIIEAFDINPNNTSSVGLDGAKIVGGMLVVNGTSDLIVVQDLGATFDGVSVSNSGTVQVDVPTSATTTTLTLDDGTTISGGNLMVGSSSVLDVEVGPEGQGGALLGSGNPDATLNGVNVTNNGTIDVGTSTSGATLTLKDGTSITGGALNIGINGELYVQGVTLDNVGVTNNGSIELGFGSTLALDGGTTISGGTLTFREVNDAIVVDANGVDHSGPDATLDGVKVNNVGGIEVISGAILALDDGTTVTGGTSSPTNFLIDGGATLDIEPGAINGHGATLNNVSVSSAAGFTSVIKVGGGSTLTLNGTTIVGSIIDDFSPPTVLSGSIIAGDIDVTGSSEFERTVLNNGNLKVEAGQTLTLDNVSLIGTGFTNTVLVDDTASGAILQIDGGDALVLADTTISGGTIDAFSPPVGTGSVTAGDIDVSALSKINGGAVLNNGAVTVVGGVTLKLDDVTANGTTFNDTASGAVLQIDAGDTLTLQQGTSITGGTLSNFGMLQVETALGATLDHVSVGNASGGIQIDGAAPGASTLLIDDGTTITGGTLTIGSVGTLDVEAGSNGPGATLDGVGVFNNGTIDVGLTASGTILTLEGGTTIAGGALTIGSGSALDVAFVHSLATFDATLDGVKVTNNGAIDITPPGGAVLLADDGTTISGGTLTIGDLSAFEIEVGTTHTQGAPDVTLDGVKVINIGLQADIDVDFNASGAILALDGGTTITGGELFVGSNSSGQVDVQSATLDNVFVCDVGSIELGKAGTLVLDDGTTVLGSGGTGMLSIAGGATLDIELGANGLGATLENATVSSTDLTSIIKVGGGGTLTLKGATISGGTINDFSLDASGDVIPGDIDVIVSSTIDSGAVINKGDVTVGGGATLKLDNVTVNGTSFTDTASGAILQIDAGDTLTLEQGASITGGTLSNSGILHVETTLGATLDHVSVGNASGAIQIDGAAPGASTLLVDDGTKITGGTLTVGSLGVLDVEHGSNGPGATLDGVGVFNNGTIEVGAITTGAILALDGGTTISGGALTIASGGTLDIEPGSNSSGNPDATLDGVTVLNSGTIEVVANASGFGGASLTLDGGATISGGTLTVAPDSTLTLNDATISNSLINRFGSPTGGIDVTGSSTLNGGTVLNDSGVTVESSATLTLDDVSTFGDTFIDTASGAALQVDGNQVLVLDITTIKGGTINDAGAIDITGSSTIADGAVINNGTVMVGGGATLTLDNVTANGVTFIGAGKINVTGSSTIDDGAVINNGTVTVGNATLTLNNVTANDVTFTGAGTINNVGTIAVDRGSVVEFDTAVTGAGSAAIGESAILEFKSGVASSQTVTFAGNGILSLGQPSGFAGEIVGFSGSDILDLAGFNAATTSVTPSFDGADTTLTVMGGASTASITLDGDYSADKFGIFSDGHGGSFVVLNSAAPPTIKSGTQASGALSFSPTVSAVFELQGASVSGTGIGLNINSPDTHSPDQIIAEIDGVSSISVSGGSTSAPNDGVNLISAGASLEVFNAGNIAASGPGSIGIFALAQAASGTTTSGNVSVNDLSNTTVSGDKFGIAAFAGNGSAGTGDVTVNVYANATIDSTSIDGIFARNSDTGNTTVTTSVGDIINSGGVGIAVNNDDTSIAAAANSVINVNAFGTIHSGSTVTSDGNPPAGILAGYVGGLAAPTNFPTNLFGSVFVNSSADITADAGDGIRAFNDGTGDVTIHDNAGSITALGGTTPVNGFGSGINARNSGGGNIVVTTGADASIDSGGSGINVFNLSTTVPSNSSISVVAKGTIVAGSIPTAIGNLAAGILAGYNSSTVANPAEVPVPGVHGNVTIDDFGSITAVAGDDGIRGINDGTGTVTITAEAGAVITASGGALHFGIDAFGDDGGNVSVTNFGSVTGGTDAINAHTTGAGISTIDNHGQLFGDVAGNNATFTNELNADWSVNGTSAFTGTSTLTNLGAIESNGTSEISGLSSFTNTGTIEVQSGSLKIDTAVSGAGVATIDAGTTLEFGAAVAAGETVTFAGANGTLIVDTPSSFAGKIVGIAGSGDVLDLKGFDAAHDTVVASTGAGSFNSVTNTTSLVVTDQTQNQSVTLKLAGDLSGFTAAVTADGHGGADITVNPVVAHDDVISNSSAPSGDGWVLDTDNGHFYRLVTTQLSWDAAKAAAEADGAYLATITSQAEQDFVTPLAAGNRAWLGGESTDDATGTGHFFWLTGPEAGTPFDFTHWRPGEPNGGFGATEAVHIEGVDDPMNGGWNDAPTDAGGRDFIEEWGGLSGQIAFREGTGTTIATSVLLANDTDLNNMKLTVTSVGDSSGHSLHGGTVSLDGNIVTYAPAADFSGADSFSYTVSDGSHTSTATVNFNVANTLPVIETDQFSVAQNPDGTTTISGLKVLDADPAVSTETFTETATTAGAPGSSVAPSLSGPSSLSDLNAALANVTYNPGATPPLTDKVTLTVADSFGTADTVNFVFNQAGNSATTVLTGTAGKDVIFATGHQDILTGGGGQDQFVFKPTASPTSVQHTVTDFVAGLDKIDVRQFNNVSASNILADVHQQNNDTLITLDTNDSVLLKNVVATNLHANDFIVHG